MEIEFEWYYSKGSIIGVIQSFEVLPPNTPLNFSPFVDTSDEIIPDNVVFTPLPTAAIAYTQTKPNDFIVNVRDKPDSKGKIVTQLLTQKIKIPDNFCLAYGGDHGDCYDVNPLYEKMVSQGHEWIEEDGYGTDIWGSLCITNGELSKPICKKKSLNSLIL